MRQFQRLVEASIYKKNDGIPCGYCVGGYIFNSKLWRVNTRKQRRTIKNGAFINVVEGELCSVVLPLVGRCDQTTAQLLGAGASGLEGRPVLWRFAAGVLVQLNQPN